MKKILLSLAVLSSTLALGDTAVVDFSPIILPEAEVTLKEKNETFFRTLIVSEGKIIGDLVDAEKIPNINAVQFPEETNYCEFRLAFSFFGPAPQGKFSLPQSRLTMSGKVENTTSLTGMHCRHDDTEMVRLDSLYSLEALEGPRFPTAVVTAGDHRMLVIPIGTSCSSHYQHSELPSGKSFDALKKGFANLIQLK